MEVYYLIPFVFFSLGLKFSFFPQVSGRISAVW